MTRHLTLVNWGGKRYRFEVKHDREAVDDGEPGVEASASDLSENGGLDCVARVTAHLINRPHPSFRHFIDGIPWCRAKGFFENDGILNDEIQHPQLDSEAAGGGGLLYISEVEVHPSHQGNLLGLRLLHELLVAPLEIQWTLAMLKPEFPECRARQWNRCPYDYTDMAEVPAAAIAYFSRASDAVRRHLARMGFVQAGLKAESSRHCFLTRQMYQRHQPLPQAWLTKEETATICFHLAPPNPRAPFEPADVKLVEAVIVCGYLSQGDPSDSGGKRAELLQIIRHLVTERGASIHQSRALFVAAGLNCDMQDNYALRTLLQLGGEVDEAGEGATRPLHIAADRNDLINVRILVDGNADILVRDELGRTPLQVLESKFQCLCQLRKARRRAPPERHTVSALRNMCLLMPPERRQELTGEWMSPRMRLLLHRVAEEECELQKARIAQLFLRADNRPKSLDECYDQERGIRGMEYIPPLALVAARNMDEGVDKSFALGWAAVFEAIRDILEGSQTPTVQRLEEAIAAGTGEEDGAGYGKVSHFKEKGGKIEYALDALFQISSTRVSPCAADVSQNPLDNGFDIGHVMCINRGGGQPLTTTGPYEYEVTAELHDDDDEDDIILV